VAEPELYNGGADGRGEGSWEGAVPPSQKKIKFSPENGEYFGAF